ncbi:MAG: endonuclease/exonuclease/phosphatase family protein [Roseibacillus sp.]|jgi:endonuclease/exonuclease/phosphatase family metal-dependent hydrolase
MARILFTLLVLVALPLPGNTAAAADEKASRTLRLVAYNIKHGRGMDGKVDLERIAAVLRELKPDLVALQEVDNKCARSGTVDEAEALGKLLGMEHRFGKFMDFQGGEYGLAVLSRFPITDSMRHPLAPGAEPRCALEIVIHPNGDKSPLSFVSIHNDWTKEAFRVAQVNDLIKGLGERNHPVVLAGDFNARPGDKSLKLLEAAKFAFIDKKGAKTFPSPEPRVEIDYFMTRGMTFKTPPLCTVHDERMASDHRPIATALPLPLEDK